MLRISASFFFIHDDDIDIIGLAIDGMHDQQLFIIEGIIHGIDIGDDIIQLGKFFDDQSSPPKHDISLVGHDIDIGLNHGIGIDMLFMVFIIGIDHGIMFGIMVGIIDGFHDGIIHDGIGIGIGMLVVGHIGDDQLLSIGDIGDDIGFMVHSIAA